MNVESFSMKDGAYMVRLMRFWDSLNETQKKNIEDSIAFWQSNGTICSVYDFVEASFDHP